MVRKQKQPPAPHRNYRQERYDQLVGGDELMRGRSPSKQKSGSRVTSRRQIDPDGRESDSPPNIQDFYTESLKKSRNPGPMHSAQIGRGARDRENRRSSGGVEEESRQEYNTRQQHYNSSPREGSRRRTPRESTRQGNSNKREGREVDTQTVLTAHTEYDNIIVSKAQQQLIHQQSSTTRRENRKGPVNPERQQRVTTKPSDDVSMASSIDNSSGIIDHLEMDLDNVPSANTLPQYRPKNKPITRPFQATDEDDSGIMIGTDRAGTFPSDLSSSAPSPLPSKGDRRKMTHYRQHRAQTIARGEDDQRSLASGTKQIQITGRDGEAFINPVASKNYHTPRYALPPGGFDDYNSVLSGATSAAAASTYDVIKPLRWTEQETDNLLMQLEFFGDNLSKDVHRFPTRSVQKVINSIQAVVEKDSLRRDDPILQNLSKALHSIRVVDLDKLLRMLQENHKVGHTLAGKRVLLLCGPSGSGKTTTLHFMAGTTLEEVDEQGFFHLKPVQFKDHQLKDFETSSCRKHVTRTMQATSVQVDRGDDAGKEEIIICDTPGLGHADCVEDEISNGLGMITELQRAKSIHPVLLLSRETLGSRFDNLLQIINAMRAQFILESKADLLALNYLFTKYEGKHRTRICKQVAVLEHTPPSVPEESRVIYKAFVKDLVKKTSPKANLALPMEDKPERCLQDVWDTALDRDGKDLIVPFATKAAMHKLKLQLQLTVYDFSNLLAKGDYPLALHRLHQLQELAHLLPDARESAEKTLQVGTRHVLMVTDLIREMIEEEDFASALFRINELRKLEGVMPEVLNQPLDRITKRLRKRLKHTVEEGPIVEALKKLAGLRSLKSQLPQAKEFVKSGFDSILKRLLRTMERQDVEATMYQLEELSQIAHKLPEASDCAWHALRALNEFIHTVADTYDFDELLTLLHRLRSMSSVFPEGKECIQVGFESLKKKSIEAFEGRKYSRFISQTRLIAPITIALPPQHESANRVETLVQDTVLELLERKDFNVAVDILLGFQGLQTSYPESTDCIRNGFEVLLLKAIGNINEHHYEQSIDEMIKLGPLLPSLSNLTRPGFNNLVKNVEITLMSLSFEKSATFVERLHAASQIFPEIHDAVELAVEDLLKKATSLVSKASYAEGLQQLFLLGKIARKVSIPSQVIQRGISDLQDAVQNTFETLEFDSCLDLLHRLDKVSDMHPQINKLVNEGFEMLLQKAGQAMTVNDYSDALIRIEALGEVKHKFDLTQDCVQRGIAELSMTMNKLLQYTDFSKAVDVLQHLFKVCRAFPETMHCVRLGYELLLEKAVDVYEHKRFSQAVGEIRQLGHLFHQFKLPAECNKGNLKYLATAVPRSMQESDFGDALATLRELIQVARLMPDAMECVHVGYEALLERSIGDLSSNYNKNLVQQLKQLAQAVESVPEVTKSRSQSLHRLQERLTLTLGDLDFSRCKDLLEDFNTLVPVYPEVEGIVLAAYKELQEKTARAFEKSGGSKKGIHHLHQLSQLAQFLKINKRGGSETRGHDLINRKILETLKERDFETGRELLEGLHNLGHLYPPGKQVCELAFRELQQKVALAFDEQGYRRAISQLQGLIELGILLQIEARPSTDDRGVDLINSRVLDAMKRMDFEAAKELLKDLRNMVQLQPEATSLIIAAFRHLQEQTALAFELSGCQKGMAHLQELAKLRQSLDLKEGSLDGRGSDQINLKALEAMTSLEFSAAIDFIEKVKKLMQMYPEGKEIVEVGFGDLLERTAVAFGQQSGYNQGVSQLQQLGELRQLLFNERSLSDKRGNELLKQKILEASRNLKFETAVELTGRVNKIVHLYPEAEEIVVAGFKQLLTRTALTFENNGHQQGIGRLQQLGQLKQVLEMDERILDDSRGNILLKRKVLDKMKSLDFKTAFEIVETISEQIVHMYPDAIDVIQAGFGDLLDKTAVTFEKDGYGEGIKQLREIGLLKHQLELDEGAIKESRRRLVLHLVDAAQEQLKEIVAFPTALEFVKELNDVAKTYPEAKDGVEMGFESLVQRVVVTFEQHKCSEGSDQLEQLSELQQFLGLDNRALRGLESIVGVVQRFFEESELEETIEMLTRLSRVADKLADARECVNVGVQIIWKQFEETVKEKRYDDAAGTLQEIGAFTNVSPLADRYFSKGMKRLKKIADSNIEGKDFMDGIELSKTLSKIEKKQGETKDATVPNDGDVLRIQMEKRILQHDYSGAADIIHNLTKMAKTTPQASEYVRAGLKMIEQQMESSSTSQEHTNTLSALEHFERLQSVIPEVPNCLENATELLKKSIEKSVERKAFDEALSLIEKAHKSPTQLPQMHDFVQYGMCLMGKAIEKPLATDKYDGMADLIHRLSKSNLPRAGDNARRGLKGFWKTTKHSIEEHQYGDAIILMRHMRRLAPDLPEAGDCVQLAFVALRVRLVKAIDKDKYEVATALLKQLSSLAEELPEAFECAQFGFEALQERLEKRIEEENYKKLIDQMRFLGKVAEDLPEVAELFAVGFSAIASALAQKIDGSEFKEAVELMEQLCELSKQEEERTEALDCTRQGLFKFWGKFEDQISEENYSKAVSILQHLGALANVLSEAEDGVQLGFEVLEDKFESMIEKKQYDSAVSLMQDLSKLAYELPEASSCIQNGFEVLRERLVKIIEQQDYSTARNLISMLEQELPSVDRNANRSRRDSANPSRDMVDIHMVGIEHHSVSMDGTMQDDGTICSQTVEETVEMTIGGDDKVGVLRRKLIRALDERRYSACLDVMVELSIIEHVVPDAGETLVFGCNLIKDHLEMSIHKLNCTTVLEVMRILEKKTHRLPVAGECNRFGLQQLQKSVEKKVELQDYKLAIELMDLLCRLSKELSQATMYTQGALDEAIQHMVAVREEAATSLEELAEVKESMKFATMLETTCENLENVMATEELRIYCAQLEKNMSGLQKDPSTQITCGVRLATSESFCSDQIRRLTEAIAADFPDLLVETAYIHVLSGKEGILISALGRLLLLRRVLNNCPGSEVVDVALNKSFQEFCAFVDGVNSLAQSEFGPRMNLKSFESQIVLLTSLLHGLMKSKGSLHRDEWKKLDDLEHRRARLMLRFEIEVADSLEVLSNHIFPHFTRDERDKMSSYVRTMRISQVQKNRDILLACVHSRELASMISDSVKVSSADLIVSSFDKGLEKFFERLISQLEEEKAVIDAMPKTKAGLPATKEQLEVLCRDVPKVLAEVEIVSQWQTESYSLDSSYYLDRLNVLDKTVKELTNRAEEVNGIGFSSFLSSISRSLNVSAVSDYYSCTANKTFDH